MSWRHLSSFRIALAFGIVLALLRLHGCAYVDLLELRMTDYRFLQRGVRQGDPDIVIVAVDDSSLERIGRWPWSRALVAQLIDRLVEADVAVIGFDIVQSETASAGDLDSLRAQIPQLDERVWQEVRHVLDRGAADEERLAQAVRASGRTVLGYFFDFDRHGAQRDSVQLAAYNIVQHNGAQTGESRVPEAHLIKANLPQLTAAARAVGFFNFFPDDDGSYRRAPLTVRFDGQMTLPLSLAMLQVYRPELPLAIRFGNAGVESVRIGSVTLPVGEDGEMLVNYCGPAHTFRHVSAADVLARGVGAEVLRGKIVLVGVTATAVADVRVTPFDGSFPGVEIHANVLDNVLRRDFIFRPWWGVLADAAVILLLCVSLGVLSRSVRGAAGAVLAVTLLATYLAVSQWVFVSHGLPLTLVYPVFGIGMTYTGIALQHYIVEEREKRKLRDALALYLNPSMAHLVSQRPELLALGGEKLELTVMFSDIRGFTTISEGLEPEALVELLNAFLGQMTDVIFARDGMLDKYVGDAIMAVWGAPLPQTDHAARACRAALEMLNRLQVLNQEWAQLGRPVLEIGIGLNTGPMVVGNMGSARRLNYTVIGDNVNLGSRLEGLNKMYRTQIIASEATIVAAGDAVVAREIDRVRVKGKQQPVRIFEIVGPAEDRFALAPVLDRFAAGLIAYRERRWDDAVAAFCAVQAVRPDDGPAQLYLRRCRDMLAHPPDANWDGVTVMDTK